MKLDVMLTSGDPLHEQGVGVDTAGFRNYWFTASMSHRYLYLVFCIF